MATQTVTLVLDAAQYNAALARITTSTQGLSRAGAGIGDGFLRGERVFRTAAHNIAGSLATATSAADVAGVAFEGLERVFKVGIIPTVGLSLAITGIIKLHEEVEKTAKASKAVADQLSKSFGVQSHLSSADLVGEIQAISTASKELETRLDSTGQKIVEFFQKQQFGFSGRPQLEAQVAAAQKREFDLQNASANAQRRIIDLKETELEQGKDASASAKLLVDYENQIAKIQLNMPFGPPTEAMQKQLDNAKQLLNVESAILGVEKSRADQSRILKQQQDTAKQATDFFQDLGSGKFAKDFSEKQQQDIQQQQGRDLAKEIEEGQAKGFFQSPLSQAALKEARRISDRAGTSVQELANTDFSNLLELSKYDFSGLQPLNGLTLQIQ